MTELTIPGKYPSKSAQVTCWYCDKSILKQTHTEMIHIGKVPREKIKGASFDLFEMAKASKRSVDEEEQSTTKKPKTDEGDTNKNVKTVDLNNSVDMGCADVPEHNDNGNLNKVISDNHIEVMHHLKGIKEGIEEIIEEKKGKEAKEVLSENDLIVERTRSVLEFCALFPEFQFIYPEAVRNLFFPDIYFNVCPSVL